VSHSVAGLLATAVIICMGVFAPIAFWVARRVGPRLAITAALAMVAAFGVARALAGPAVAVISLTIPVGIGIAVAGSLLPLVVRESWPSRPVLATAVYTTGISLGATVSAAVAIPLAHSLGSWREPLEVFSVVTAALALAWVFLSRGYGGPVKAAGPRPRLPWRSRTGWLLVALFALVSITYYGINAWLPASFTERGWSAASAGALLTIINAVTVPTNMFLALRGDIFGSRRFWLATGASLQLVGLLGVIAAPSLGWTSAVLIGVGIGLLFPSLMTLPIDVADHPSDVAAMAALMLGAGYSISAVGPSLLGLLRDTAGSFTLAMWVLLAITAAVLLIALLTAHERLRRHPRSRVAANTTQSEPLVN
jgi:CP family cyanate transporter-like MFS transporter